MSAILTEIIAILYGGITGVAQAFGTGLSNLVESIFLTAGEGGALALSTFGGLVCIFAGISLTVGLTRWCLGFCTSLGQRNR